MSHKAQRSILPLFLFIGITLSLLFPYFAMADKTPVKVSKVPDHRVVVYYLHNTFRCSSCNSIGDLTKAAVLGGQVENLMTGEEITVPPVFQELVDQGKLSFAGINVDEPENRHFLQDFHTKSKFPVIAELQDGKILHFKVLHQVWKLLKTENGPFISYIQENVQDFIKNL